MKFEFRKSDKTRIYRLVSSPETHEKKNHGRLLRPLEKNQKWLKSREEGKC